MATTITITIGNVTATRTTSTANGQAIATDLLSGRNSGMVPGVPVNGTPQEQVDWLLNLAVRNLVQEANAYKRKALTDTAVVGVDARDWV